MSYHPAKKPRHLVLILGDQLDPASRVFTDFDPAKDALWMAEVRAESTHVWSHKARIALFLSAMRHFAQAQKKEGKTVHYKYLDDGKNQNDFASALRRAVGKLKPARLLMTEPGAWRVGEALLHTARGTGTPLEVRPDGHFISSKKNNFVWSFSTVTCERKPVFSWPIPNHWAGNGISIRKTDALSGKKDPRRFFLPDRFPLML
jgi:deoxyribodipyrimidine photolyase-like uncharacterized protein